MLQCPSDVSTSGGGPEVNKFEQVSIDAHQMLLPGGGAVQWGPMSGLGRGAGFTGLGGRDLYSKIQCLEGVWEPVQWVMGNGHMAPPVNRQTDTTENITFPQLRWWAVLMDITNS